MIAVKESATYFTRATHSIKRCISCKMTNVIDNGRIISRVQDLVWSLQADWPKAWWLPKVVKSSNATQHAAYFGHQLRQHRPLWIIPLRKHEPAYVPYRDSELTNYAADGSLGDHNV